MRRALDDSGSTSLEFALVAPIWVAFVIGIVQTGALLCVDNMMHNVVDATARCMAINVNNPAATKCHDVDSMRAFAVSGATGALPFWARTEFQLNDSHAGSCTGSQVSIVHRDTLLFAVPVTISAKACYPNWS